MLGIFLLSTFVGIIGYIKLSLKVKKLTTLLLFSLINYGLEAQTLVPAYQNRANQVSQANITNNLQTFGDFGVKTTGSTANTNALNWLKEKYTAMGYSANQMQEDPFSFNYGNQTLSSKNLVITKQGTVYPNTYVIICAHYDTITGRGVNDNGSGTSILLEAARILKDIPTEYSVKFIHFSGEEQGLYGSYHYADNVAFQNGNRVMNIRLVFNIDQVGGKIGNLNDKIKCESDQGGQSSNNAASLSFTQQLATYTTLYSPLQTVMSHAYSSDYMPFEENGDIITGFYENTESNTEHTVNDTFANVDPTYVYNVGKAAVGALQHFAVATTSLLGVNETTTKSLETVKIYPNPAKDMINIDLPNHVNTFSFELTDMSGRSLLQSENQTKVSLSGLSTGTYLATIKTKDSSVTKKLIIEK